MPITPLPVAPSRAAPTTFSDRADALISALVSPFVTEANALEANVNAKESSATASAAAAIGTLASCDAAKAVAQSASNFKGAWSSQAGAANVPYSVSHLGKYWQLVSNLADVTTKTPGTDPEWMLIVMGTVWNLASGATNAVVGNGYICDTSGAGFTLTLPGSPVAGDYVSVTDGAGTFAAKNLTIGRNSLKIMGLAENLTINENYAAFSLVYSDATNGWRIAS